MNAWDASPTDNEAARAKLMDASEELLAWLTTPPTTMAGVIATLEYATQRDCDHSLLLESAHYDGKRLAAADRFPAMIARALRTITSS